MTIIKIILMVLVVVVVPWGYIAWLAYRSNKNDDEDGSGYYSNAYKRMEEMKRGGENDDLQDDDFETSYLAERILRKLGCEPIILESDDDDDTRNMGFRYQGKTLVLYSRKGSKMIDILCYCVYSCQMDEPDEMCLMKRIVNELNWENPTELLYKYDEVEREAEVTMRRNMYLSTEIKDAENYLRYSLDVMLFQLNRFYAEVMRDSQ